MKKIKVDIAEKIYNEAINKGADKSAEKISIMIKGCHVEILQRFNGEEKEYYDIKEELEKNNYSLVVEGGEEVVCAVRGCNEDGISIE